jgi:hypothetical protein
MGGRPEPLFFFIEDLPNWPDATTTRPRLQACTDEGGGGGRELWSGFLPRSSQLLPLCVVGWTMRQQTGRGAASR